MTWYKSMSFRDIPKCVCMHGIVGVCLLITVSSKKKHVPIIQFSQMKDYYYLQLQISFNWYF